MSRFIPPYVDVGNGISPANGALLFFFETGTSTNKDTYSDEALTVANANPVVANSKGVFPDIWLGFGGYKVRLKDKNSTQEWEADAVRDYLTSSSLFIDNYQDIRDLSLNTASPIYAKGKASIGDGGESFFHRKTGGAPGTYADDNDRTLVPSGGDGSAAWVRDAATSTILHTSDAVQEDLDDYLNKQQRTYATVAAMVASNIAAGSLVEVAGYYAGWAAALEPKGKGTYYVCTLAEAQAVKWAGWTVDEKVNHTLASGNIAMLTGDEVTFEQAGAKGDGVQADVTFIQAAVDSRKLAIGGIGTYLTDVPIVINEFAVGIKGKNFLYTSTGTHIKCTSTDCAIKILCTDPAVLRVSAKEVTNIGIEMMVAGGSGINFSESSYGNFRDIFIRLQAATQSGIYARGNTKGSAPYYNNFDNIVIFGNADDAAYPNQRGFHFQGDGLFLADGPNANKISNCGQISGVKYGFDFESGHGNLITNVLFESIHTALVKIGWVSAPAIGRATGNKFVNLWTEGKGSATVARFEGLADNNDISGVFGGSLSSILFDDVTTGALKSNYVTPQNIKHSVMFTTANVPAGVTTQFEVGAGVTGGVIVPFSSTVPFLLQVTVTNFASGGLGSGVIKFKRSGIIHAVLQFTVNDANRFGGVVYNGSPDAANAYNTFDGTANSQAEVEIVTDGTWNQTGADINVQVLFLG